MKMKVYLHDAANISPLKKKLMEIEASISPLVEDPFEINIELNTGGVLDAFTPEGQEVIQSLGKDLLLVFLRLIMAAFDTTSSEKMAKRLKIVSNALEKANLLIEETLKS